MLQERIRLNTKFKEELRTVDPTQAAFFHIKEMWRAQPTPNIEDLETIGSVVSNIFSDEDDYLIVTDEAYILVGKSASAIYGTFDGFSSGNKSRKQIIDGLSRTGNYTIYKIRQQFEKDTFSQPVVTLLDVENVNVAKRLVYSKDYGFHMDEIDLDRSTNTFIVKELSFDGKNYYTKHGTLVKNIVPRKVNYIESTSTVSEVDPGSTLEDPERQGQRTTEDSTE